MRQLGYISFSHIYSLYNKGLVQVQCAGWQDGVCSFVIRLKSFLDYLAGEDRKKIRNYLVVSNNFILSLSLSHSNITLSLLVVYVLAQCVARYGVSTKGLLYLPFVDFFVSNRFFSYILIGAMLTRMGNVPFLSLPLQVNVVTNNFQNSANVVN